MKAPAFRYVRPTSLNEALDLLVRHAGDARLLAGGQSLLPAMNLRMAMPGVLIDLNGVAELSGIRREGDWLRIGAMTRHVEVLNSPDVAHAVPLLAQAMPHVAHTAVRNRGTFGGSVALADPSAEIPAVCVAVGAEFELFSPAGARRVKAEEFFLGTYFTALGEDEILVAAHLPVTPAAHVCAFDEMVRRHGDYAIVGTCAQMQLLQGVARSVRLVQFGACAAPLLASQAAAVLEGQPLNDERIAAACAALNEELDPVGDLHTSADAKRHLAGVQLRRTLQRLAHP